MNKKIELTTKELNNINGGLKLPSKNVDIASPKRIPLPQIDEKDSPIGKMN